MNARIFSLVLAIAAFPTPQFSCAESLDTQQKAVRLITDTADKICNVVSTTGEANSSEVKGSVSAQLSGLASKLADLGVSGTGSVTSEQYQNVLRSDLAAVLRQNTECRLSIFNSLKHTLLNSGFNDEIARASTISGIWVGGTGRYTVTQEGKTIIWDGIGTYGNRVWHHKGQGMIKGNTIIATFLEAPGSNFPGVEGGAPTEGTISADGQTISWTGQNPQERIWHRGQ